MTDMPFDPQNPPTRRGRRDPDLQLQLESDHMGFDPRDSGDEPDEGNYSLLPGDRIMGKTSIMYRTPLGEAWSTFGAQTIIQDDEDVDAAFTRLSETVNSAVFELADDAVNKANETVARARQQQTPPGRIPTRG